MGRRRGSGGGTEGWGGKEGWDGGGTIGEMTTPRGEER